MIIRRISLTVVLLVGVIWAVATVLFNLWGKAGSVDKLTDALQPAFTNSAVTQYQSDVTSVNAVITDLNTTTIPTLATDLHKSPADVSALLSTTWPDVGKLLANKDNAGQPYADGKPYVVHAADYMNTIATTLKAQQHNFAQTSDIPIKGMSAQGVTWLFLILGLVTIAIGLVFIWRPAWARPLGALLIVLALAIVVVSLVIDVPGKTRSADALTDAFRPVFATSGELSIDTGQQYLQSVAAADKTLQTQLVPTVASLLSVTPDQASAALRQASPTLSHALFDKDPNNADTSVLGGILNRWDGLAATVVAQRHHFADADDLPGWGMPTTIVQFLLVGPAMLILLAAIGWLVPPYRRLEPVPVYGRYAAAH